MFTESKANYDKLHLNKSRHPRRIADAIRFGVRPLDHRRWRCAGRLSPAWLLWPQCTIFTLRPIFLVIIIVLKVELIYQLYISVSCHLVCNGINIILKNDGGLYLCFFNPHMLKVILVTFVLKGVKLSSRGISASILARNKIPTAISCFRG